MVEAWITCSKCGHRFGAWIGQCPQCHQKNKSISGRPRMSRKKKIILAAVIVFSGWIALNTAAYFTNPASRDAVDSFASQPSSNIYDVKTDPKSIIGIANFQVVNNGGVYQAYFSLQDRNAYYAADNAKVDFMVRNNEGDVIYTDSFNIKRSDFMDFQFNAGGTAYVYAWNIEYDKLREIDYNNILQSGLAEITVTLSDARALHAQTDIF